MPDEVLLLGLGAVGTLYAYILQSGGANVTAVCRSNYQVVRDHGIDIVSDKFGEHPKWRPTRVIQRPEDVDAVGVTFDYIVCCSKHVPDLQPVSDVLRPYLTQNFAKKPQRLPVILLLQNGIDIEQDSYEAFVHTPEPLAACVMSANSWVPVMLLNGGARIEHGSLERLSMGVFPPPLRAPLPDSTRETVHHLLTLMIRGGSDAHLTNDITSERWRKVLWNMSWGGVSLLARRPVFEMLQVDMLPYTVGSVRGIMLEILTVARASGMGEDRLPASVIDHTLHATLLNTPAKLRMLRSPDIICDKPSAPNFRRDFKPSILIDLELQRPMELEPIFGNIIRRARQVGVDTPRLDLIVTSIKPSQLEYVRRSKGIDHETLVQQEGVHDLLPSLNATGSVPTGPVTL